MTTSLVVSSTCLLIILQIKFGIVQIDLLSVLSHSHAKQSLLTSVANWHWPKLLQPWLPSPRTELLDEFGFGDQTMVSLKQ